ncbi:conserved repeat domain protein [[Clostridium] bifermentans ATCC 638]|uniref:Conserved repeat domain protein n=1 Tax=Paraclostridium bifermentans ATCC 638 = DSM 14991 TaxID=1233171 RepID=T4VNU4_PARBF|nr:DUF11 domain-containing protein [Paraclostridium bifermentans]EQK43163.1 conserved repeat domain protein [[Clostridium] bifermentans ATCC 638] [Paraclostridium bifermentans ATCC 638 = DSM 14991]RIZ60389.1 hypothetical protein CHH45_01065 [Paraclostridium bifermentans]UAG17031.1 DUF11 domain-containing protein [Paraclostridium bifermentans]
MIDQNLVKQRIDLGLGWVVLNQNQDKSFGTSYPILNTALVVLELEQYAISQGIYPLDVSYKYYNNLVGALEYLFLNANQNNHGIYYEEDGNINYTMGVVLAAICASQSPDQIINNGPNFIKGISYKTFSQDMINYLEYSQEFNGGWGYSINNYDDIANNYVSGYVGLGLLFATNPLYKFNLQVDGNTVNRFSDWVDYIQNNNGGSGYSNPQEDLDILKTGNLLLEMNFLNRLQTDNSVMVATNYKANNWYEPAYFLNPGWNSSPVANYQATYALMGGLTGYEFYQIDQTVPPFEKIDYISDVTNVLLQQQNLDGSFKSNPDDPDQSDQMMSTIWALLTLQAVLTRTYYISLVLSSDNSIVRENDIVTYTVNISNIGNVDILNAVVKDTIPPELSFIDGSVTIDGVNQPVGVSPVSGIEIGSVKIGNTKVVTYKCKVLAKDETEIKNMANVTFDYIPPYGRIITNKIEYSNELSIRSTITSLAIAAEVNKTTAVVGEILTYTIDVTNNGKIFLSDIIVIDPLDPNLQYMNNLKINGIPTEGNIVDGVNIGSLDIGETTVINFDVKIISVPPNGTISTEITATYDYNKPAIFTTREFDDVIKQDKPRITISAYITVEVTIQVIVVNPEVSAVNNVSATSIQIGETAIYNIKISNSGKLDSLSTLFATVFPPQLQVIEIKLDGIVISGDLVAGISLGPILSGKNKTVSITVKGIGSIIDYRNNSKITMEFLPVVGDPVSIVNLNATADTTLSVEDPQLILTEFIFPTSAKLCDQVIFEIKAKNIGSSTLQNVIVSNFLPASLQYVPCSMCINGCVAMNENIFCGIYLGTMYPEQECIIRFKAKLIDDSFDPIYNFSQANFYYSSSGNTSVRGYANSNLAYLFID